MRLLRDALLFSVALGIGSAIGFGAQVVNASRLADPARHAAFSARADRRQADLDRAERHPVDQGDMACAKGLLAVACSVVFTGIVGSMALRVRRPE